MTIACPGSSARTVFNSSTIKYRSSRGAEGYGPMKPRQPSSRSRTTTLSSRGSRLGKVPNPSHGEVRCEEDEEKGPRLHGCADSCKHHEHRNLRRLGQLRGPRSGRRAFLPRVRSPRPARPGLRLRGVFRPAGDRVRLLGLRNRRTPQAHRSGSREHLALRAPPARPRGRRREAEHQPRLDQARPGRQPRARARCRQPASSS